MSQTELSHQAHNLINGFNIIDGEYIRHIDLALRIFNLFRNIHRREDTAASKRALRHTLYQLPGSKSTVDNYVHNLEQDFITFIRQRQTLQASATKIQTLIQDYQVREQIR